MLLCSNKEKETFLSTPTKMPTTCNYPIYTQLWFWLVALGILFLAIGLILWDTLVRVNQPWWIWALMVGGGILLAIGLFLAIWRWWSGAAAYRQMMNNPYDPCNPYLPTYTVEKPISQEVRCQPPLSRQIPCQGQYMSTTYIPLRQRVQQMSCY